MKVKTTKKEVLKTNQTVLQVGYCDLQNLLRLRNPYGYTCGADGWHADIYDYGTTAICTGYQPLVKKSHMISAKSMYYSCGISA